MASKEYLLLKGKSRAYTSPMDLKQLRYFLAISELKSLTAAAEKLNVTQPALGQQMRKLEADLGVQLIERHSRGVQLTEAGICLKSHAEDIMSRVSQTIADVRRFGTLPSGTVRLGVTPSLGRVIVPALLETVSDRFPEVSIQFTQGLTDQLDRLIGKRELEIAVTHSLIDTDTIETLPLYLETIYVIGHKDLIGDIEEPMTLAQLVQLPMALDDRNQHLRRIVDKGILEHGLQLHDYVEIPAINIRRELVTQGRRCVLAPYALFPQELEAGTIMAKRTDIPGLDRVLHLASSRVERLSPAESAIRGLMVEAIDNAIRSGLYGWRMPDS